jgi:DNA-binding response OmpR family regulator
MKPRVLIFDEDDALSSTLKQILDEHGYEVFTFTDHDVCPLFHTGNHPGISDSACSDIIISDIYMPTIDALKRIKERIDKGCKVGFRALMSTTWSNADWKYARELGCQLFRKPFDLPEMLAWLDDCTIRIDPTRKLLNWNQN